MNNEESNHHVAWADRLGLNKQWSRDIERCSDAMGTPYFPIAVRRFKNNIINIKNGPSLHDIINKFENIKLQEMKYTQLMLFKKNYPEKSNDEAYLRHKLEDINMWGSEQLFHFMLQLLEDHGFCFYESNIEEDEMR